VMVKIYVEGAGKGDKAKTICREAFSEFFGKAGLEGRKPGVVVCGSRNAAFKAFCVALRNGGGGRFLLLLVDSEGEVPRGVSAWHYLADSDQWERPDAAADDQVFLMVQAMESWLLADPDGLEAFFGKGFRRSALPRRNEIEAIPKDEAKTSLERATEKCGRPFAKGDVSFKVLGAIDPNKVRSRSPHAEKLLAHLEYVTRQS
jgi:Domain of unknown function (DUF4276)